MQQKTPTMMLLPSNKHHHGFSSRPPWFFSIAVFLFFSVCSVRGERSSLLRRVVDQNNRRTQESCLKTPVLNLTTGAILVEFVGRPENVTLPDLDLLEETLLSTYNSLAEPLCSDDSFLNMTTVQIDEDYFNLSTATSFDSNFNFSRPFAYLFQIASECRGCDPEAGLFLNQTSVQSTPDNTPCPLCTGPTLSNLTEAYNQSLLLLFNDTNTIDFVANMTQFEPVPCVDNETTFETDVLVDFLGDPSAATASDLQALEVAFLETYNNLNTLDPTTCDPLFRVLTEATVVDTTATYNRRQLQSTPVSPSNINATRNITNPLVIFFNFDGLAPCMGCVRIEIPFTYYFRVRGTCNGCMRDADIYDDGFRRRQLQMSPFGSNTECYCPVGAETFRPPTREEFQTAYDNTVQELVEEGQIASSFIETADEVVEVDQVACDAEVNTFFTQVTVTVQADADQLQAWEEKALEDAFETSYNEAAQDVCDPLFRTVLSTILLNINATARLAAELEFRVVGRCRGCPPDSNLFDDVFSSTRSLITDERRRGGRRLEDDQTCFCDTTRLGIRRAQSRSEFEVIYNRTLSNLRVETVDTVVQVSEERNPALEEEEEEWFQLGQNLTGLASGEMFGTSVCMSEDGLVMAAGAPQSNDGGTLSGRLRVYQFNVLTSSWDRLGGDIYGQPGDRIGAWCSMSGDGVTVAAFSSIRSLVYVYTFDIPRFSWLQLGDTITGVAGEHPVSLSTDGLTIAVGHQSRNLVRVLRFTESSDTWVRIAQEIRGEFSSDFSGTAVALSGDAQTVVIGAPGSNDAGSDSGHVRVYIFSADLMRWTQFPPDTDIAGEAAGDEFGSSVAISRDGRTIAVGAPFNRADNGGMNDLVGHVKVYTYSAADAMWMQVGQDIEGVFAGDEFGDIVSLSSDGRTVAIGAYLHDRDTTGSARLVGQVVVFVYVESVELWVQRGSEILGDATDDRAGEGMALSGDGRIVAVGIPRKDSQSGSNEGGVRTYQWIYGLNPETNGTTLQPSPAPTDSPMPTAENWMLLGSDIDGEEESDRFGQAVCLSNDGFTLAVGSHLNDGVNGTNAGQLRVFVFQSSSQSWVQVGQDIEGSVPNEQFGFACSMSKDGQTVAVYSNVQRRVQVFVYSSGINSWGRLGQVLGNPLLGNTPLSLSGDGRTIAVGDSSQSRTRVMRYDASSQLWVQIGQEIDGQLNSDGEGTSLALSEDGRTLAIGGPLNDAAGLDAGHVRVFTYSDELNRWSQFPQDGSIVGEAAGDGFGTTVAMSSDGLIVAVGAPSSSADENPNTNPGTGSVRVYRFTLGSTDEESAWLRIGQEINGLLRLDQSGSALALSDDGLTLAVGASFHDAPTVGTDAGHVRVFVYVESASTWVQRGSDLVGEAPNDRSGTRVAISGNGRIVAIGAPRNDNDGRTDAGQARVYEWTHDLIPRSFTPAPTMTPTTPMPTELDWTRLWPDIDGLEEFDRFGFSVCMSADGLTMGAGAPLNDANGTSAGLFRVFSAQPEGPRQYKQLGGDIVGTRLEQLGYSCSMSADGRTVALYSGGTRRSVQVYVYESEGWSVMGQSITALGETPVSLSSNGRTMAVGDIGRNYVRVFRFSDGLWAQFGPDIVGATSSDSSGGSVSISGDGMFVAVGAVGNAETGLSAGEVRIFFFNEAFWTPLANDLNGETGGDGFGYVVALSRDRSTVAVGAPFHDLRFGHVRVFSFVQGEWTQRGNDIDGTAMGDQAGQAVALSANGQTVAIGARFHGTFLAGQVRVFDYSREQTWVQRGTDILGEFRNDQFGTSLALSDDGFTLAIGAPLNNNDGNNDAGQVRIYQWPN